MTIVNCWILDSEIHLKKLNAYHVARCISNHKLYYKMLRNIMGYAPEAIKALFMNIKFL